nr:uncharacterized protein LOC117853272 isoform X2 [Setaria viridis]
MGRCGGSGGGPCRPLETEEKRGEAEPLVGSIFRSRAMQVSNLICEAELDEHTITRGQGLLDSRSMLLILALWSGTISPIFQESWLLHSYFRNAFVLLILDVWMQPSRQKSMGSHIKLLQAAAKAQSKDIVPLQKLIFEFFLLGLNC